MADPIDWSVTGWEGHRRRQHQEFRALPLRDKLVVIEQLDEVAAFFAERRRARGLPVRPHSSQPAKGEQESSDPGHS